MKANREIGLETIVGLNGKVTLGWVGHRVLYARFVGTLSVELNLAFIVRLRQISRDSEPFLYFSDARGLQTYDIAGKQEFLDFVLERQHQLEGCVSLTWQEGESAASRAFVARVGQTFEVLTNKGEFEERLFAVAPLAQHLLTGLADADPKSGPTVSLVADEPDGPLDDRVLDNAERILEVIAGWLQSHDNYRCELKVARAGDWEHLVWDAVLKMARFAGFQASRRGTTVLVSRTRPRPPLD
jgi:hypothetical protein